MIVVLCLVLTGCKATSTLTVTLGENASGTVHFQLVLDQEAASALRRDSFDTTTLTRVFDSKKLRDAGFTVEVKDKDEGPSTIDISGSFSDEEQLRAALSVIAPASVVNATLDSDTNTLREKQNVSIVVDAAKLRSLYLEDPEVKKAVEASGIDAGEFETLVNDAMTATTLTVVAKHSDDKAVALVKGTDTKAKTVELSRESIRVRYLLNMAGAIIAGILAIVLLWRLCRTPRLLSEVNEGEGPTL